MNKSFLYLLSSLFWVFLSFVGFTIGGVGWVSFAILCFFISCCDIYLFISEISK